MPVKKVLVEPRAVCTRKAVIVRSTKKQQLFVQRKSSNCSFNEKAVIVGTREQLVRKKTVSSVYAGKLIKKRIKMSKKGIKIAK